MDEPEDIDNSENKEEGSDFDPNKIERSDDEEADDFEIIDNSAQSEDYEKPSPDEKIEVEPKLSEQEETGEEDKAAEQKHANTVKEDIIANEEKEIKKIIEEGEKAARYVPVPPKYEGPPADASGNEGSGAWKWFLAGIGIAVIIGIIFLMPKFTNTTNIQNLQHSGPLAVFDPSGFLQGWKLDLEYLTLADLPTERKKELIAEGNLTDVATWQFSKGGETLYVWIKEFANSEAAKISGYSFAPINWQIDYQSVLSFGDEGRVGVYKAQGQNPLTAYVRQDNTILSVAYFNEGNQKYNPSKLMADETFLSGMAKGLMTKIVSANGQTLKISNRTV
ncbi:MAG: hypothetical protein V1839_02700 [archaeon]